MAVTVNWQGYRQLTQTSPTCQVQINFSIGGFLPKEVQIYLGGRSDAGPTAIIESVDMTPPEIQYGAILELPSASALTIALCPREETNGVPDPEIDGEPWYTYCVYVDITTQGAPTPGPHPKQPAPAIGSIEPHQVTLHNPGTIDVHWQSTVAFDLFHFSWMEERNGWHEIEINSAGRNGVFTVSPATAGLNYQFKIQGCISKVIGLDDCSDFSLPIGFRMPPNTRSLRTFLRFGGVQLTPGIRSLGSQNYGSGLRAMMHL